MTGACAIIPSMQATTEPPKAPVPRNRAAWHPLRAERIAAANPDDLLTVTEAAEWLSEIRARPIAVNTLRGYIRKGMLPAADASKGGRKPRRKELVRAWPGYRLPVPGERIGATDLKWKRSTITEWDTNRPGKGATAEARARRAADRAMRYPADTAGWWRTERRQKSHDTDTRKEQEAGET